ncbi:hypothetical protein D3C76_980460 [compost metagenome]
MHGPQAGRRGSSGDRRRKGAGRAWRISDKERVCASDGFSGVLTPVSHLCESLARGGGIFGRFREARAPRPHLLLNCRLRPAANAWGFLPYKRFTLRRVDIGLECAINCLNPAGDWRVPHELTRILHRGAVSAGKVGASSPRRLIKVHKSA